MAATHEAPGRHEQARDHMAAFLTGAREEMVDFPKTVDEMRVYWRDVGRTAMPPTSNT